MSHNADDAARVSGENDSKSCGDVDAGLIDAERHARVDAFITQASQYRHHDYDRLEVLAGQAYQLACQLDGEEVQYRSGMAASLSLLAHLSGVQGESETALLQAGQALALLDSPEPSLLLGELYLTLGWAHFQTGDYADALNELVEASHIAETVGARSLAAYAMDRIANVYHATRQSAAAIDLQRRALEIFRDLGDSTGEAMVLNNMTYTYLDLGRHEEALGSAFGALHYAESTERLYMLMGVLDTVAEVYLAQGDLDSAAEYSAQGLELASLHHSEPDTGDSLFTMARIAYCRAEHDSALVAAEDALAIAEKHHRAIEEFTCHELLSRIQEARGDIGSALEHHRRFHELERTRINQETESRLAGLQVQRQLESARKNAEIHRLRSLALQREVEERKIAQAELEAQASLDPLTGLFNRRHISVLSEDLRRELSQGRVASLILFDIDHFKQVNDTFGHFAGDRVLVSIARMLDDNARDADTPCRYGGDEFLILLSGTGPEKARAIAERIRAAIDAKPVEYRGQTIPVAVSVGVATVYPESPATFLRLIEHSDRALYAAKQAGRNCIVVDPG